MSMELKNILIYIGLPVLLIAIALIFIFGLKQTPSTQGNLKFWGFEDESVYTQLIKEFNGQYPYIKIDYIKKSQENYERELLNAMASGQGPDIFLIHHTWVERYKDKISSAPEKMISLKNYYDTFVDVVHQDFVSQDGYIWAVPFYVDTLALYWNKEIFNTAGIPEPPKNWSEFNDQVARLTSKDEGGNIVRSGAAMGTALNINNSCDILSLIMLQSGTKMVSDNRKRASFNESIVVDNQYYKPGEDSLRFYTDFSNPQKTVYTWNARMGNSLDSFMEGKTAIIIDYSSVIPEIQKKSPYLKYAIAPIPQLKNTTTAVNYADYWGQAVWSGSQSKDYAWTFILWMSGKENMQKFAENAKKPVSRRDLISWQQDDTSLGVFATQALSARSWFQIDNRAISDIFKQAIESVVLGQMTTNDAIERAASQVNLLMEDLMKDDTGTNFPIEIGE